MAVKIITSLVKKILCGSAEVKTMYIGSVRIFPNIVSVEQGNDYGAWVYSDPTRTRSVTPWSRDVYSDGSKSEKRYGAATSETQTATTSYSYGAWTYGSNNATRSRSRTLVYTYTDVTRNGTTDTVSESGTVSYGTWVYSDPTRTRTVSYVYSDTTKAGASQTQTATTSYTYGAWSYGTDNATRSCSRTLVYTYTDVTRNGTTDTVSESGTVSYGAWVYSDPTRTRTVSYVYSDTTKAGASQTQTATVSTDWDGTTHWMGMCGSDYYYTDYRKVRDKYTYPDTTRYGNYKQGAARSLRTDGKCGWVKDWRVIQDWTNTGSLCNAAGEVGKYDCDGNYTVTYHQQIRTLGYLYPDMKTPAQPEVKPELRAGSVASRTQVAGQCGFISPSRYIHSLVNQYEGSVEISADGVIASDLAVVVSVRNSNNKTYNQTAFLYMRDATPVKLYDQYGSELVDATILSVAPSQDQTYTYLF